MPKYSREAHRLAIESYQAARDELPAQQDAALERVQLAQKAVDDHERVYRELAEAKQHYQTVLHTVSIRSSSAANLVSATADPYIQKLIALQQKEIDRARASFVTWGDVGTRKNEVGREEEIGIRRDNAAEINAHIGFLNTAISELHGLQLRDVANVKAACAEILAKVPQVFELEAVA